MDKEPIAPDDLLEQSDRLMAKTLAAFSAIIQAGTGPIEDSASTGAAVFNSMAMEIQMNGLIKVTEDLLALTRQLRELWVVGRLKMVGEGEGETQQLIKGDAARYFETLNVLRRAERLREIAAYSGSIEYSEGPMRGNPMPLGMPGVPGGLVAPAQSGGRV
ncbi:hypothetical protein QBC34DRAFT_406323 [Podospora aff. communis PSN243]|uniref:Mediator complex subunit 11 n=1 Tax=Podospora aff. communis PSN243 TaxID=3040156 RepID=A0AAV9GL26_9PEZI|nr:hypothetical protein QBC34DRAFT_406323 [Podospora aff. communis PSN243]